MARQDRVLVLDGADASYSLTVARSLGAAGYDVDLGFAVGTRRFEAHSKFVTRSILYPDPVLAEPAFRTTMLRVAPEYGTLVPTTEKSLLATSRIRAEIEALGTILPTAPYGTLLRTTHKTEMLDAAREVGIRLPRTKILSAWPGLESLRTEVGFPLILKSSTEIGAKPIDRHFLIDSANASTAGDRFRELAALGPVLAQEYVVGTGVGVALLYDRQGALVAFSGHRRRFEQFADGGPSLIATSEVVPRALADARRLLESIGWRGVAMVEFRVTSDGTPYFMEINPRFWGTLSLAIAAGVDFPRLLVERFVGGGTAPAVGPSRTRNYFSIEATITAAGAPAAKRVNLGALSIELAGRLGGLSIRELQGWDLRPSMARFGHLLRARGSSRVPGHAFGLWFGPAHEYSSLGLPELGTILDLRTPEEVGARPLLVPAGVRRIHHPIPDDRGVDVAEFRGLIAEIDQARVAGEVYIHCRKGMGRAPMIAVGWAAAHGKPLERAFDEAFSARPRIELQPPQVASIYAVAALA